MLPIADINPLTLPSLPLEEKLSLPECPAIYFAILEGDEVLYIGRATNLARRWLGHHRYGQLKNIGNVKLSWLECENSTLLADIELALIDWFDPPLNGSKQRSDGLSGVRMYCRLNVLMAERNLPLAKEGKHLSQRGLAEDLNVSPTTVNKLYNGRPMTSRIDPEVVEKICNYFSCNIGDLFEIREEVA